MPKPVWISDVMGEESQKPVETSIPPPNSVFVAFRTEERIGFPDLLDEFAPFLGRDAARFVFGNVNHISLTVGFAFRYAVNT